MDQVGLWGRLTVGRKIGLIGALFLVALFGTILYTLAEQLDQDTQAVTMDFVGRQRELPNLYARDALLASEGRGGEHGYWATVFNQTVDALLDGGAVTTILKREGKTAVEPAPSEEIRARLRELRELFSELTTLGQQVLGSKPSEPTYAARASALLETSMKVRGKASDTTKAYSSYYQAEVRQMVRNQLAIGILVGILGILLSWFISKGIVGPLSLVVANAQGIARGDLRQARLSTRSGDEIGRLAMAFNAMQETLKEITAQTHEGTLNLDSACQEILASTQQQAASTREQAAAVQEITSTVEEVRQAGVQISERAKQVARPPRPPRWRVAPGCRRCRKPARPWTRFASRSKRWPRTSSP